MPSKRTSVKASSITCLIASTERAIGTPTDKTWFVLLVENNFKITSSKRLGLKWK